MEEAAELANYLPLSFKTESEQEYIQFLWEAFESNYENKKYQFAFLATQQAIVAEIEAEQALVAANRELIARFEKKIQATLARVWGEEIEH